MLQNKLQITIICALFILISSHQAKAAEIFDTKCGNIENPIGVSIKRQNFSWKLKSEKRHVTQSAYQILVSDNLNKLDSDEGNIWNSGKVASDASIQVDYKGALLEAAKKYFWKVKVWDNEGSESEWSEVATFQTGLFSETDWGNAKWIGYEELPAVLKLVPGIHGNGDNLGEKAVQRPVVPLFRKSWGTMDSVTENNTLQEFWKVKHDSGNQWSHRAVSPLIMIYYGILGIHPVKPGFEKCTIMPQPGDIEKLEIQAHTVKGMIAFEMTGKQFDRIITISVPQGMDCEMILDHREKIELPLGSEIVEKGQKAYKLPTGKNVKLDLKYL
jgi:hypothetical protein